MKLTLEQIIRLKAYCIKNQDYELGSRMRLEEKKILKKNQVEKLKLGAIENNKNTIMEWVVTPPMKKFRKIIKKSIKKNHENRI